MSHYGCKGLTRSYDVIGLTWGAAVAWALARVSEGKRDDVAVYHVPSDALLLSVGVRDGLCVVRDSDGEVVVGERRGGTPKPQGAATVDKPAPVVKCRNCNEPAGHHDVNSDGRDLGACCGGGCCHLHCGMGCNFGHGWTARPLVTP